MRALRGGTHLPIAHALHLPEPKKKKNLRAAKGSERSVGTQYVEGKKETNKQERIMPNLVDTTFALACTTSVRTHSVRTNIKSTKGEENQITIPHY